jgi:carbamoyltransferase
MGLAPYGNYNAKLQNTNITYLEIFRKIIKTSKNNPLDFKIDKSWVTYHLERDAWVSKKFKKYFGFKRKKNDVLNPNHINIAAALQKRLEEVVVHLTTSLIKKFKIRNICISGGVGLNCSLNGKILNIKKVNKVFVQPAANDAGTSYGSALFHFIDSKNKINTKRDDDFFQGKDISVNEIKKSLNKYKKKIFYKKLGKNLYKTVADLISQGNVIAWVQGKNEFGPRALGNRSLLARPYPAEMKDRLNIIKKRETFRPFAPAVLEKYQNDYFKMKQSSFHMLYAFKAKSISKRKIPAAIHVDDTARVQSVNKKSNLKFYKLLKEFYKKTKCPVLLNTSLNIKGQPMINYSDDAIECMLTYDIDYLILNNFIIKKN